MKKIKKYNLKFASKNIIFVGLHYRRYHINIQSSNNFKVYSIPVTEAILKHTVISRETNRMFNDLGYYGYNGFYTNKKGSHIYFNNRQIDLSGRGTGIYYDSRNKILTMKQLIAIVNYCLDVQWLKLEDNILSETKEE